MSNTILYEQRFVDLPSSHSSSAIDRIQYVRCAPPARLRPKGTIVLLHDIFRTSYQFRHVVDLFAMGGYHILSPDLPPKTQSSRPMLDARISIDMLASQVSQFLRSLSMLEPIHLIGCGSFGSQIAFRLNLIRPELVASLIFCHSVPSKSTMDRLQPLLRLPASCPRDAKFAAFKQLLASPGQQNSEYLFNDDIEEYVDAFADPRDLVQMQLAYREITSNTQSPTTSSPESASEAQAKPKLSTTDILLLQTEDEPSTSILQSSEFAGFDFSSVMVKNVDCCTTSIPEDQPEHFAISILSFLHASQTKTRTLRQQKPSTSARLWNMVIVTPVDCLWF